MKLNINNCARCGENHKDLLFIEFTNPVVAKDIGKLYTHFCLCPTNSEPILMRVVIDDTN